MSQRNLLIVVVVLLAGIFAVMLVQSERRSPGERLADNISEVIEEAGDEIDDHTTN